MSKKDYSKTTKVQFELFKKECEFWIDHFGLKGWLVEFKHKTQKDDRAYIFYRGINRIAVIGLSIEWESERNYPIGDEEVKRSAFHEVCELMFAKMGLMASGKMLNGEELIEEETHNLIRILENTVFKRAIRKEE